MQKAPLGVVKVQTGASGSIFPLIDFHKSSYNRVSGQIRHLELERKIYIDKEISPNKPTPEPENNEGSLPLENFED